ncbi:MAG: recombination regulator RecX [Clostridium sp.]|nr:recombination regulator RecX [Clostridium sp.]
MSKITKIEIQKRNKERVNIYVDDQFFAGLDAELVYKLNIKKGDEINPEKLKVIAYEDELSTAKNKAMNILNRTAISEKKLREKLSDYDEDIINEVINKLKEYKFLNDKDLAKRISNDNLHLSRFGRNKIKQNLYRKGICKEDIENTIEEIDSDVEFENALYLGKKRYDKLKGQDNNVKYQKISQHLAYKGFNYDIIKRVLNELLK